MHKITFFCENILHMIFFKVVAIIATKKETKIKKSNIIFRIPIIIYDFKFFLELKFAFFEKMCGTRTFFKVAKS